MEINLIDDRVLLLLTQAFNQANQDADVTLMTLMAAAALSAAINKADETALAADLEKIIPTARLALMLHPEIFGTPEQNGEVPNA